MIARAFAFCPSCSEPLVPSSKDSGSSCPACGEVWYSNPAPTAGCVIVQDGRALVTVRGGEPYAGKVDIPGGFMDAGETPVETVKRELLEELGVEVDVSDEDYVQAAPHRYGDGGEWTLALGFKARLSGGDPTPNDDVAAIKWVSEEELDGIDFAWEHDRELVRRVLRDG